MSKDDPEANCLPAGVPRMAPYPWKIVQTPTLIVFLYEGNIHSYRQIFLDGRGHAKDPNPTWYGDSIGKWEGDTLVVDTIGFNDKFWFDFAGASAHREAARDRALSPPGLRPSRLRRDDRRSRRVHEAVHDARPLALETGELMEYVCNENNQDVSHIVGKDNRK